MRLKILFAGEYHNRLIGIGVPDKTKFVIPPSLYTKKFFQWLKTP